MISVTTSNFDFDAENERIKTFSERLFEIGKLIGETRFNLRLIKDLSDDTTNHDCNVHDPIDYIMLIEEIFNRYLDSMNSFQNNSIFSFAFKFGVIIKYITSYLEMTESLYLYWPEDDPKVKIREKIKAFIDKLSDITNNFDFLLLRPKSINEISHECFANQKQTSSEPEIVPEQPKPEYSTCTK